MKPNLLALALLPTLLFAQSAAKKPDPVNELAAKLVPTRKVVYKTTPTRPLNLHIFEPSWAHWYPRSDFQARRAAIPPIIMICEC